MRRRNFIGSLLCGSAAALSNVGQSNEGGQVKPGDIPRRRFGKTGQDLTVIGQAGGRLGLAGAEEAKAVVLRACDLGINYFDSARIYWNGHSEEIYGQVLPPFRKQVFITSKSHLRKAVEAERDLHLSLKSLKTDYLDLWQIHQVNTKEEVEQIFGPGGAIEAFEAAKKAGKCRFIGFTGHRDPAVHLEMLRVYDKFDTILMPLNIADPHYLSFEKQVLPVAVERGLGIQGMKNFGNAKLLQSFGARDCLSYVLTLPIHCTAVGCTTIGQLEDDVRIAKSFKPLPEADMEALRKRALRLKGPGLEDWKRNTESQAQAGRMQEHFDG